MSVEATEAPGAVEAWSEDGAHARLFSGHESFVCRAGWLPKLHEAIRSDPRLFESDERAILALGLGRNMVKSLRFWGDAYGLTRHARGETTPTLLAKRLLDPDHGIDPYLEDSGSLWRLHWRISTRAGLGAWVVGLLECADVEIDRERLIELVRGRAGTGRRPITQGTAVTHVDMLLRTYDAARAVERSAVAEESLGCPMQELGLLEVVRRSGRSVVRFRRGARNGLDVGALAFAVHDFWLGTAPGSSILSLRSLLLERRSPGVVFRMDEGAMHASLERLCDAVQHLELADDGVGGINLTARQPHALAQLEELAWPSR